MNKSTLFFGLFCVLGLYACQSNEEAATPIPALSPLRSNIEMGDQGSAQVSFFASASGDGYEALEIGTLPASEQSAIDITFGTINAERTSAFVSPASRATTPTNNGFLSNPMGNNASRTTFKEEPTAPADLAEVTPAQVQAITGNGALTVLPINTNRTYSFINERGKKGFIRVKAIGDLDGQGDAGREVRFDIIVQR